MGRIPIFLCFILIFACKTSADKKEILVFYYQFEGFEKNDKTLQLLKEIKAAFAHCDYVINSKEVIQEVKRSTKINVDTLEKYHPYIHRIEVFNEKGKFKDGSIKLVVTCLTDAKGRPSGFNFCRYSFTSEKTWKVQNNIGAHELVGAPVDAEKRTKFIIFEIARASFK
jgi:hypothetical protein